MCFLSWATCHHNLKIPKRAGVSGYGDPNPVSATLLPLHRKGTCFLLFLSGPWLASGHGQSTLPPTPPAQDSPCKLLRLVLRRECVYSCTYFGLNDENPKVTFRRGFWTHVAYLKTGTSGRPVISIEAQERSSYAPGEASRVVLEPPLEADHSEALLPFPWQSQVPRLQPCQPLLQLSARGPVWN